MATVPDRSGNRANSAPAVDPHIPDPYMGGGGGTSGGALESTQQDVLTAMQQNLTATNQLVTAAQDTSPVAVKMAQDEYETVAASATDQVLGATGAIGDYLAGIIIVPGTTSPGNVIIKDGSTTVFTFAGGASSVSNLVPFYVAIGAKCVGAGFKVTTGTNVTVFADGDFT